MLSKHKSFLMITEEYGTRLNSLPIFCPSKATQKKLLMPNSSKVMQ